MLDASLTVTADDGVSFRFVVTNPGNEPVEVTFRDACHADFAVLGADGQEVWRWSAGRAFAQVLEPARFEPDEAAVFEETWPEPEAGAFTARATLRTVAADVSAEASFSV